MISISHSTRRLNAYDLKVSEPGTRWRGYVIVANNLQEVQEAISHYFHGNSPEHNEDHCPLCRRIEERKDHGNT